MGVGRECRRNKVGSGDEDDCLGCVWKGSGRRLSDKGLEAP